ncbi:MAG TPA: hypothetical protein VM432_11370 [Bdellovibrionales bacterium]|nr:hypothetical protein [Bdellovibrionales bacterium]
MVRAQVLALMAVSAVLTPQAFGQTAQIPAGEQISTYENPVCKDKENLGDLADKGYMISENSIQYKGRCVDSKKFRPLIVREDLGNKLVVENFLHKNRFWKATIPTGATAWKQVYMQIVRFPVVDGVIAAHGQLRFVLADDVSLELESQSGEKTIIKGAQAPNSIIWSVEASFPKGVGYNFAEGAFNNYPIVARVGSAQQRMSESSNPIEQYIMALDKDPAKNSRMISRLVKAALLRSDELGMNKFYNTIRPNCISEAFDMIDKVRGVPGVRPFYTVLWVDPVAGPALRAMKERGILGARDRDLQQEFQPTIGRSVPPPLPPKKGVIRELADKPFTLVTVIPKSGQSARVMDLIEKETDKTLSQAIPRLSSAAIVPALVTAGSAGAIGGVLAYVQSEIGAMIDRINPQLPEKEAVTVISYLTPWGTGGSAKRVSLVEKGIPADLPFDYLRESDVTEERVANILNTARTNMLALQTKEFAKFKIYRDLNKPEELKQNPKPAFLMGLVVRLKLQRDRSESTVQAILSMVPQDLKFATAATVDLNRIHIPMPLKSEVEKNGMAATAKSTMIITHVQVQHNDLTPSIQVDFGRLQPFHATQTNKDFGIARVPKRPLIGCGDNFGLVPEMQGVFFPNAFGIKPTGWNLKDLGSIGNQLKSNLGDGFENYVAGKPVMLGIYSLKFVKALEYCHKLPNNSKEKIKFCRAKETNKSGYMMWDMDIGVRALGQNCLRLQQVSDQVAGEGNMTVDAMILDAVKKGEKLATDTVMGAAGPNAALLKSTLDTAKKLRAQK